jgi:glyceraldehyde 3-phosphate dehydrogenase
MVMRAGINHPDFQIMAINDLADAETLTYLFNYDSIHGRREPPAEVLNDSISVDGRLIPVTRVRDPEEINWSNSGVDLVIESTGVFSSRERAAGHLEGSAKKVIIAAPAKDADATFVCGINEKSYDPQNHHVVSNASCTTNALAPVAKVLNDEFGILNGFMNTVHAYTSTQALLDIPSSNKLRGRAAALNIVPSSTGAAIAVGMVLPELDGKLDGMSLRTPNPDGSIVDLTAVMEREASVEEINAALERAAKEEMKGILKVTHEPLVSSDILGDPHSSIVDAGLTMASGNLLKVLAWYDNEWGYACRLIDLAVHIGRAPDLS